MSLCLVLAFERKPGTALLTWSRQLRIARNKPIASSYQYQEGRRIEKYNNRLWGNDTTRQQKKKIEREGESDQETLKGLEQMQS